MSYAAAFQRRLAEKCAQLPEVQGILPLSLALSQAGFGAYIAPKGRKVQRSLARGAGGFGGAALSVGLSEALTNALSSDPKTRLISALLSGYAGGMLGATAADEAVRKNLNQADERRKEMDHSQLLRQLFEPPSQIPELGAQTYAHV